MAVYQIQLGAKSMIMHVVSIVHPKKKHMGLAATICLTNLMFMYPGVICANLASAEEGPVKKSEMNISKSVDVTNGTY